MPRSLKNCNNFQDLKDLAEARIQEATAHYEKTPYAPSSSLKTPGVSEINLLSVASNSRLNQHLTHRDQYLTISSHEYL